jgi:predicted nucleotide-binding protein
MVPPMADKTQVLRPYYLAVLNDKRVGLDSILARYETLGPPSADDVAAVRRSAKAFVSHGGQKRSLTLIEDFLRTLGVEPVVAEKRASEGRELHDNVDNYRRQSDFAVILLTKDIRGADDVWHPSGSVEVEVGELKTQFQGRVIYLKEEGVKLPGMVSTLVHETFTDDNMGPAYMKIVTELYGWGWLTISPPEAGVE